MLKAQVTQIAQFQKMLSQAESVGRLPGLPALRAFVIPSEDLHWKPCFYDDMCA